MEAAAADECFGATRARIKFGIAMAATAAIKEKPFSFRINASSLLVVACRAATEL
jgi:hypothetical protein